MKKKDWAVLLCVLALAGAVALVAPLFQARAPENRVVIRVDNQPYATVPLSQPQSLTIAQGDGAVNVVEITANGVRMASSTCRNQNCVHQGEATLENYQERAMQGFIICLPNRVTVELQVEEP